MRQGLHLPPRALRPLPAAPSDRAQGLEGLGRRRLPRADAGEQGASTSSTAAATDEFVQITWEDAFDNIARALDADRHALQRRGGREAPARAGLPAGDGRGDGRRRHAHDQDARRHGPAGRDRQVRHVPPQQLAGAARRASPRRRARGGQGRPQLVELHLARRPGPGPSLGARPAGLRLRLQRPALLASCIIMDGKNLVENKLPDSHWFIEMHGARRQDRGHRARVRPALHQGRLLDPDPAARPTPRCSWASRG